MNYLRTAILLAGLTALFMGVGFLIGGEAGAFDCDRRQRGGGDGHAGLLFRWHRPGGGMRAGGDASCAHPRPRRTDERPSRFGCKHRVNLPSIFGRLALYARSTPGTCARCLGVRRVYLAFARWVHAIAHDSHARRRRAEAAWRGRRDAGRRRCGAHDETARPLRDEPQRSGGGQPEIRGRSENQLVLIRF